METIRSLLDLIKTAHLVNNNVPNLSTDTGEYTVTITVRKSQQKNKFWMHEIRITKKEQGLSSSGDVNPQQEYNKTLAHKGIVSQNPDTVNNKFSDRDSDDLKGYLEKNEVVYDKTKMNGKYQVGSGRIVTVTHDTPFIEDIISQDLTFLVN